MKWITIGATCCALLSVAGAASAEPAKGPPRPGKAAPSAQGVAPKGADAKPARPRGFMDYTDDAVCSTCDGKVRSTGSRTAK